MTGKTTDERPAPGKRDRSDWWRMETAEAARLLATDAERGLSEAEARARLAGHGPNALAEKKGHGPLSILLDQFRNLIIWVLMGAALVSGFLQEWVDALAIVAIVILNAILGFIQEFRAEKSLEALKKLSAPMAKAVRDGHHLTLPARELVPGDLVEVEAGDNVPADARIIWHTANFAVQEASLTGESTPVAKTVLALQEPEVPLAERANMVYLGTSVTSGKARALVAETGMGTELGKIAGMIQSIEHVVTPLQRRLEEFGKWIVYAAFALVGIIFLLGVLRGGSVLEMFLTAVSLAVAAIPEGLPAVVTIALALGVRRMVKRHALIRKLPSVETLGCATVICSDKTGTLTRNEMTVRAVRTGGERGSLFQVTGSGYGPEGEFVLETASADPAARPDLLGLLRSATLCNGAELYRKEAGFGFSGDPTEIALLSAAAKAGVWKDAAEKDFPFEDEIPFDSERKKMTMVRRGGGVLTAFVKGAPDILLADCARIAEGGSVRPLTAADREAILRANDDLADQALRVLAVARRDLDPPPARYEAAEVERDLVFEGLLAMIDPPREEAKEAVRLCREAGIRTVMITGDHKKTAVAIARELGFFQEGAVALTGEELDRMGEEEFQAMVVKVPVYARVSPEHKLRIVRALKKRGDIVAMTGDGVNDAPAVKEADIGVAMGITGTDVTKEVADMVVTDDNFASIVAAVEEGRGIYDNIKKFVHYLLSCNAGEILVMFTAVLVGLPSPLLPIQILWVNLVTDGLPALALGVDNISPGIMKRKPRRTNEPVIPPREAVSLVLEGAVVAACSLVAFGYEYFVDTAGLDKSRTMAFLVLAYCQDFHSYNCRSQKESLFRLGFFSNRNLVAASLTSLVLQLMVIYTPFMRKIFRTVPLTLQDWEIVILLASVPFWIMEAVKFFRRRADRLATAP